MLWIPGVERIPGNSAGSFTHPVNKWLWHTTEGSSITGAVAAYRKNNSWPHLTWNPITGEIVQHLPFDVAARSLKHPPGTIATNTHGVIQVEVVARAAQPFTDLPRLPGLDRLRGAWKSLGIPESFPAGPPPAYPGPSNRSVTIWRDKAGHFCHANVPNNDHGDPGKINPAKLFLDTPVPNPQPQPQPTPEDNDMSGLRIISPSKTQAFVNEGVMWILDTQQDLEGGLLKVPEMNVTQKQWDKAKAEFIYMEP